MNVKTAIKTRRSIRKYRNKEITDGIIKELLDAARLAPSGNNAQPSRYFIVKNKETKNKLKKSKIFAQDFVYDAPVIIVCCADSSVYKKRNNELDDQNEIRAIRDLSIASAFLMLRATELGLGTCYVGWVKKHEIKKVLDIPATFIIPYVITVGYSAEKPKPTSRKSTDEILINSLK